MHKRDHPINLGKEKIRKLVIQNGYIIENCDMSITFLVNGKRGTEIITENMFEHLLHFATQAALQIFFQACYEYCFTLIE